MHQYSGDVQERTRRYTHSEVYEASVYATKISFIIRQRLAHNCDYRAAAQPWFVSGRILSRGRFLQRLRYH